MMCEIQWQIRSIIEPMASLDNNFRGLCMHGINDITWLCKDITKTTRIMHLCFLSDDILTFRVTLAYIILASALHAWRI